MTESEVIKFLLTGFVGGVLVTGMFWWAHVDDLKRIIDYKERAIKQIRAKKKLIVKIFYDSTGAIRFE